MISYSMTKVCKIFLALFLLSGFYTGTDGGFFSESILYIKSFKSELCEPAENGENYSFWLRDFDVKSHTDGDIKFTGKFLTENNVTSPLKVTVNLRRSFLGIYIRIPCFGQFGSCPITDLCEYGFPEDKECPPLVGGMSLPCRCPIEPGLYKMPGVTIKDMTKTRWASIFSGGYSAIITLYQGDTIITCYDIQFTLG